VPTYRPCRPRASRLRKGTKFPRKRIATVWQGPRHRSRARAPDAQAAAVYHRHRENPPLANTSCRSFASVQRLTVPARTQKGSVSFSGQSSGAACRWRRRDRHARMIRQLALYAVGRADVVHSNPERRTISARASRGPRTAPVIRCASKPNPLRKVAILQYSSLREMLAIC
jgi:hypothetical protein